MAKALRVTVRAVENWIANGCPGRQPDGTYDLAAIARWRTERAQAQVAAREQSGRSAWRERRERAQCLREELRLEQERGQTIQRRDVVELFVQRCVLFRRGLEGIARKVAPRLVGLETPADALAILALEHRHLLEAYAADHPTIHGVPTKRGKGNRTRPRRGQALQGGTVQREPAPPAQVESLP